MENFKQTIGLLALVLVLISFFIIVAHINVTTECSKETCPTYCDLERK